MSFAPIFGGFGAGGAVPSPNWSLHSTVNLATGSPSSVEVTGLSGASRVIVVIDTYTASAAVGVVLQLGDSGGYDTGSTDYRRSYIKDDFTVNNNGNSMILISGPFSTAHAAIRVEAFNIAARSSYVAGEVNGTAPYQLMGQTANSKAYDRLRVQTTTGNFTGGTMYVYTCSDTATLIATHNLASGSPTSVESTGLSSYGVLVATGRGIGLSSSVTIGWQCGSGSYDTGSSDYLSLTTGPSSSTSTAQDRGLVTGSAQTSSIQFQQMIEAFNVATPTYADTQDYGASTPLYVPALAVQVKACDRIKWLAGGAANFNAGDIQLVGYSTSLTLVETRDLSVTTGNNQVFTGLDSYSALTLIGVGVDNDSGGGEINVGDASTYDDTGTKHSIGYFNSASDATAATNNFNTPQAAVTTFAAGFNGISLAGPVVHRGVELQAGSGRWSHRYILRSTTVQDRLRYSGAVFSTGKLYLVGYT